MLAGLTCVADWIGSDETFFPADRPPIVDGDAVLTACHAVTECGFAPMNIIKGLSFEDVFGFPPHAAQQEFIERVTQPGLYIMEAPMGLGKTEAALYVAYSWLRPGITAACTLRSRHAPPVTASMSASAIIFSQNQR